MTTHTHDRARWPSLVAALLLLVVAGCDSGESQGACSVDGDCPGEALCIDGACVDPDAGDTLTMGDTTTADATADTTADPCGEGRFSCERALGEVLCCADSEACFEGSLQGCYPSYEDDPTVLAFFPAGYPQGLTLLGETLYWADWVEGGCLHSLPKGGGELGTLWCADAGDHPLSFVPYRQGLAWSTLQGGVYYSDTIGGEAIQVASGVGFGPNVITVNYCNDHLAASGDVLLWTADGVDLQGEGIGRFDASTGVTDALAAGSVYVDGLMVAGNRIWFFHKTGSLASFALDAPAHTLPEVGRAVGRPPCGIVPLGAEVFAGTEGGLLLIADEIGFEELGGPPDRIGYATRHGDSLFLVTDYHVFEGPLANPQASSFSEIHAEERSTDKQISGLAVDDQYLYYTHGGDIGQTFVRRVPRR